MSKGSEVAALGAVPERVGRAVVSQFGGFLRCETCRHERPLTPEGGGSYMASGWPRCCGHTMRWWTAQQVAAGEVTP